MQQSAKRLGGLIKMLRAWNNWATKVTPDFMSLHTKQRAHIPLNGAR
jgi:hypothetical protein